MKSYKVQKNHALMNSDKSDLEETRRKEFERKGSEKTNGRPNRLVNDITNNEAILNDDRGPVIVKRIMNTEEKER